MNRLRSTPLPAVQLRDALNSGLDALPDAELLDRFARYADHPAFEVLVRRHGPMVFGVCRRMLANAADADDAFQAAFLVLIRKARSLHSADRLGPWMYGVACRVAMKARSCEARRARLRTEATDMIPDPTAPDDIPDWLPILDAELSALPAKYRDPLVLCELQGATRADAAKQLGIPEGTLSSRLARGRELLRKRLLKHGTLLPAGGLAVLFSAGNVGRATAPAVLLTRMCEVAKVATGTSTGVVPAGAARLTDEVLKTMFLTKLRLAGGLFALFAMAAIGLSATAPPSEKPGAPLDKSAKKAPAPPAAKAPPATEPKMPLPPAPPLSAVGFADPGTVPQSDRDAMQGLWVLEKVDVGKGRSPDELRDGKMQFLVAGDVWWGMASPGLSDGLTPMRVNLDSTKNPKWLDMIDPKDTNKPARCIYEHDGDKLRIATGNGADVPRPAEFTADEEARVTVMHFRREKLPPAGDPALVGSWVGGTATLEGGSQRKPTQQAEVIGGYIFVFSSEKGRGNDWIGGKYTVDTTKNPKWIDVDLVSTAKDEKVTKLYGCYEVADGHLKMALGVKRVTRPLEFKDADSVLHLDLGLKKAAPPAPKLPQSTEAKPPFEHWKRLPDPGPPPHSKEAKPAAGDEAIHKLMKDGNFAGAESLLRSRLASRNKLERAADQLMLGVCTLNRAGSAKPADAPKLFEEAWEHLGSASSEAGSITLQDESAVWVRTQAQLFGLVVLQRQNKTDQLLTAATALLSKHRGTVEELIILSLVYHARKQQNDQDKARETRDKMREAFDALKEKPGAFTRDSGEYSRKYWEETWFKSEK
jgi:RNA polymerase sigma factor (sigma-70 family)